MKIKIITSHFFPESHPRAFRCAELFNSLIKKGVDVEVLLLKQYHYSGKFIEYDKLNFRKVTVVPFHKVDLNYHIQTKRKTDWFANKLLQHIKEYYFAGSFLFNSMRLCVYILRNNSFNNVIAVSTPFYNIAGVALANFFLVTSRKLVILADSGDPFSLNKQNTRAFYFRIIEKFLYRNIKYLVVPETSSIGAYVGLIEELRIKIIPQSVDKKGVILEDYVKNRIISFAFAGVFYEDIRNPIFFLNHLKKFNSDFEFHIFLRSDSAFHRQIRNKSATMFGDKVVFRQPMERYQLIRELSKFDFLVNISNTNATQIPSKLIDYSLSGRPILNVNENIYTSDVVNKFLNYNFEDSFLVDLSRYDSSFVANQFVALFEN